MLLFLDPPQPASSTRGSQASTSPKPAPRGRGRGRGQMPLASSRSSSTTLTPVPGRAAWTRQSSSICPLSSSSIPGRGRLSLAPTLATLCVSSPPLIATRRRRYFSQPARAPQTLHFIGDAFLRASGMCLKSWGCIAGSSNPPPRGTPVGHLVAITLLCIAPILFTPSCTHTMACPPHFRPFPPLQRTVHPPLAVDPTP